MWSFKDNFETFQRSFISAISICMTIPLKSVKSCKKLQKIVKSAIRNNMLEVNCKTKDQKVIFTDMLVFSWNHLQNLKVFKCSSLDNENLLSLDVFARILYHLVLRCDAIADIVWHNVFQKRNLNYIPTGTSN